MANREKTRPRVRKKLCGLALGSILFSGLLIWAIYPGVTQAENSVVFLNTPFPPSPVAAEEPEILPEVIPEDPDQRLVSMLAAEDFLIPVPTKKPQMSQKLPQPQKKEQWQVVRMRVTGYCACPKCCGNFSDGITASNHRIRRGDTFAAADKRHPFGTELVVPGYNNARPVKVLDRGSAIQGNRLDLYFDSHQQAKKWGVKHLNVRVKKK